ncbi:class I SAM-dependent methyltransferase [Phytohabitans suffuscus]|uniref:Methyltransferase n=1 Tax=Phytohabitans suffuscus TaxID=624315 RepID=A0A6F8YZM8_9ACTN|nr:class I SAM-dependent methyltransferase [Phytohabitans suffuscus]BCB91539.1 methyltransferase [Phytohabitans suffuscus]
MSPYGTEPAAWQESWDRQQEAYLPDREERFAALLDTVDAVTAGHPPRVLDLAGGTGSISLRVLRRFPGASTTLLDLDPVLRRLAAGSLEAAGGRATVVTADLRTADWLAALPHRDFDAVLTATALHWLDPSRLTELYREIREALRPGGVFVNADHMPDDGLPGLSARLGERADAVRRARHAAGAALSWEGWWDRVAADPVLGPLAVERERLFTKHHSSEWTPPVSWHVAALRAAGYAEVGLVWRGARDAAVAAVNP